MASTSAVFATEYFFCVGVWGSGGVSVGVWVGGWWVWGWGCVGGVVWRFGVCVCVCALNGTEWNAGVFHRTISTRNVLLILIFIAIIIHM